MNPNVNWPTAVPSEAWSVLVVTEGRVEQRALATQLQRAGHRTHLVGNGREALLAWSESRFDVVLHDAILDELDGPGLVREIRRHDSPGSLTVIVTLGDSLPEREACRLAGASVVLSRPFQLDEFTAAVLAARRLAAEPTLSASSLPRTAIDWSVALAATGGRRELVVELVEIFHQEYPKTLAELRSAIEHRDPRALQRSAHQLKGCLRYFGTTPAGDLALALEQLGRSGTTTGAAEQVPPLLAAIDDLLPLLQHVPQ